MKKGVAAFATIVGLVVAAIIVLAVAVPITVEGVDNYGNLTAVVNESFKACNGTWYSLANNPVDLRSTNYPSIRNATGNKAIPETTGYSWQNKDNTHKVANGTIYWVDLINTSTGCAGTTPATAVKVDYAYQSSNYQYVGTSGASILQLLPLMAIVFVLALFGVTASRALK